MNIALAIGLLFTLWVGITLLRGSKITDMQNDAESDRIAGLIIEQMTGGKG